MYSDPTEDFINSKYKKAMEDIGELDDDEDGDDEDDINGVSSKILNTPLGVISVGGPAFISRYLDVWVIDFNFNVTEDIVLKIKDIPGVEALQVMSRYKLRVGFPKSGLFNIPSIKDEIEKVIFSNDENVAIQMDKFISQLFGNKINFGEIRKPISDKYDMWGIYVLPNGNFEIIILQNWDDTIPHTTEEKKPDIIEFNNQIKVYTTLQGLIGGRLITNKEYE